MQMTDAQRRTFEFRECLGRGGFGEVYLAKMTAPSGLSTSVAVKVLHAGLDPRSQGVRRLMDEGKILSMLNHPAIVGVHDLAIIEGRVALVTEFIEGADLGDVMYSPDPLPKSALYEAFVSVADALQAAHVATDNEGNALGLLHRDVKPGNIRIGKHGQVKLLDFGIATASGIEREAQTGTNAIIGSFAYMPPERFRRMPMEPSGDYYSLACALFECLAMDRLFHLDDMAALLGPKTDPETAAAYYDERFGLIIESAPEAIPLLRSMLEVHPEARPTGAEIVGALEDLASSAGGPRLARWARAHDWSEKTPIESGSLTGHIVVEAMGTDEVSRRPVAIPDPSATGFTLDADRRAPPTQTEFESEPPASLPDPEPDFDAEPYDTQEVVVRRRSPFLVLLPLILLGGLLATAAGATVGLVLMNFTGSTDATDGPLTAPEPTPQPEPPGEPEPTEPQPTEPQPTEPRPTAPPVPQPGTTQPDPTQPIQPQPGVPSPGPVTQPPTPGPAPNDGVAVVEPTNPQPIASGTGIDRCGPLGELELQAAAGILGSAAAKCLAAAVRDSGSLTQTQRDKLGRAMLVDAAARCKKGDCRDYEREQPVFLDLVTQSDAEMVFGWASHLAAKGRHTEARKWASVALENKSQWTGSTHISRVDALMAIQTRAINKLWIASPRDDDLRNTVRSEAAAWANYRGQVGRSTKEPMDICISAAASADLCNARVSDAVAKGKVVFVSTPAGASVKIDGKLRGTTPIELELSFGTHQVELADQAGSAQPFEVGTTQPKRWTWNEGSWSSAF